MPTYTFVCHKCEQPFERKLRMSQSGDPQECPTCGSLDTRKSIGAIAIGSSSRSVNTVMSSPPVHSPFT